MLNRRSSKKPETGGNIFSFETWPIAKWYGWPDMHGSNPKGMELGAQLLRRPASNWYGPGPLLSFETNWSSVIPLLWEGRALLSLKPTANSLKRTHPNCLRDCQGFGSLFPTVLDRRSSRNILKLEEICFPLKHGP